MRKLLCVVVSAIGTICARNRGVLILEVKVRFNSDIANGRTSIRGHDRKTTVAFCCVPGCEELVMFVANGDLMMRRAA